ncbi:ABC transporter ATP-binding protein [Radicibacter daui]|uniref:ABC transporter ATP-binding protein n=1 Tax=Radicibacter daui TaxID=3064829 RepID=UPI004046C0F7
MNELLVLDHLTLAYGRGAPAVEGMSLSVKEGELVSFLGPSGCGKSTTMRAIAGLLTPRSGRILLAGEDVTAVPPNKRGVGLVFQSYALFPHLTVFENVAFGLRARKESAAVIRSRVEEMVAAVGLAGFEHRLSTDLSGGQQQRVALARAMAVRPRLLLLDEPLSNLDARLRIEMRAELMRLQREYGITMIYVTHDQGEALALSSRIAVMNRGRIEQLGTPQALYAAPATPFVATFMGFENVFTVDGNQLAAGDGSKLPLVQQPGAGVQALAWRPQAVTLGSGPYSGTVRGASYQGDSVEYLIDSAGGTIKASAAAGSNFIPAGSEVSFDLPLAGAALIPAGAGA